MRMRSMNDITISSAMAASISVVVAVFLCVLSCGGVAIAAGYADSAHGNGSYGVNRSGTPDDELRYHTGSCAHCHDTYDADICGNDTYGLMLFASNANPASQTDNFCFQCHRGTAGYCYHAAGDGSCTATWTAHLPEAGNYNVYAWWVDGPNRATDAKYTIYYSSGNSMTYTVDQTINGGQWNFLGSHPFQWPETYDSKVVLTDNANGYVIADAIKWEFDDPPPSLDIVVDNLGAEFVCDWTCVEHSNAYPGEGNRSVQVGGITNNTYSTNFGGGSPTFATIYDAFNPSTGHTPSSHNLSDIQGYVAGHHGFTADTNGCLACHHNHIAQRNYPVTFTATGGVQTAIRRIIHNDNAPGNLWGDENNAFSGAFELTSEVIEDKNLVYQAPYYVGGSTYEPAGDSTSDGSNLPDIITFCLDCHKHSNVPSTERGRYLRAIDWTNNGTDEHGLKNVYKNTNVGSTNNPYPDQAGNYVLVCTDCHEPHGSENEWLLRTTVNGKDNITVEYSGDWYEFCTACHTVGNHWTSENTCWGDGIWQCHYHGTGGGMF